MIEKYVIMKIRSSKISHTLLSFTILLLSQVAISQNSIERFRIPAKSDSITKIMEDEVTGRIIRIFTKFDKTHLTKYTYVKGMPSIQSGFILEDGQRIELPLNEYVECIRNNFIITSNGDKIEYKTVFTLCKIEENNNSFDLNVIDTLISDGDCSMAVFLNNDRIMIQEAQEGGVETQIQIYDLHLNLLSQIKPYLNQNVSGSSYAVRDDKMYYSVEPDQYDEYGLPLPKIMIIDISTGKSIKGKNIDNLDHGLKISICENRLIGNYYDKIFGFDLELNMLWEKVGLVPSEYTFVKDDKVIMIIYTAGKLNSISGLDINDGELVWQKSISDFLQSKTVGCSSDKDYSLRIYEMKKYKGQKSIALVAGGYLSAKKRINNKPMICNPEAITLDYSGSLLTNTPIEFNEYFPVLFSFYGNANRVQVNTTKELIILNLHENK
jgi:hypothetical protein